MQVVIVFVRKCRSAVLHLPPADWILIPVVFCLLGMARLAVVFLPFKTYAPLMGSQAPLKTAPVELPDHQFNRAVRIGSLVRKVARVTPWKSLCLPQAMTASVILALFRIPQVTYFGLARGTDNTAPLLAHAWVMAGCQPLIGGSIRARFTVVAAFARGL